MATPGQAYNSTNPGVRRIMAEYKQLAKKPLEDIVACPLDDELFEWHFTIAGPADTVYAGGRYHGRIVLPAEYPMKPVSARCCPAGWLVLAAAAATAARAAAAASACGCCSC